eukprot:tig00000042_g15554.t1
MDGPAGQALQLSIVQAAAGDDKLQKLKATRLRLRDLCDSALSAFAAIEVPSEGKLADVCGLLASGDPQLCQKLVNVLLERVERAVLVDSDVLAALVGIFFCLPRRTFTSSNWKKLISFCSRQLKDVEGAGIDDNDDLARLEFVGAALTALEETNKGGPPAEVAGRQLSYEKEVIPLNERLREIAKRAEEAGSWRAEAAACLAREALMCAASDYTRLGEFIRRAKAAVRLLEKLYKAGKWVAQGVTSFCVTNIIDIVLKIKDKAGEAPETLREIWDDFRISFGIDKPEKAGAWIARAQIIRALARRGRMKELEGLLGRQAMEEVACSGNLTLALCSALLAVIEPKDGGEGGAAAAVSAVKLLEACADAAAGLKDGVGSQLQAVAEALAQAAALDVDSRGAAPVEALQALRRLEKREVAQDAVRAAAKRFKIDLESGARSGTRLRPVPYACTEWSALVMEALKAEAERNPTLQLYDALNGVRETKLKRYEKEMEKEVYMPVRAAADREGCLAADGTRRFDLDAALDAFAVSGAAPGRGTAGHRVLLLTGDSGCSKTTSLRRLHRRLLEQWQPGSGSPFPILVSLPNVSVANRDLVEELLTKAGLQARLRNGLHILYPDLKSWAARVVVTCRAQYLLNLGGDSKSKKFFLLEPAAISELDAEVDRDQKQLCEAWTCPFEQDQIGAYIEQWLKLQSDSEHNCEWYKEQINTILGLFNIIRTPFVLFITCRALPLIIEKMRALAKGKMGVARVLMRDVYKAYVTELLEREERKREGQGRFVDFAAKCRNFCRKLAVMMDRKNTTVFSVRVDVDSDSAVDDNCDRDATAEATAFLTAEANGAFLEAAPLTRSREGDVKVSYSFVHASLKEYFLADSILPNLDASVPMEPQELAKVVQSLDLGRMSSKLLVDDWAVVELLADRARSEPPFAEALWQCLRESARGGSPVASANAMTILNLAGVSFAGKSLRGVRVPGARLFRLEAAGADLRGADLSGALLDEANLAGADLRGADLTGCSLGLLSAYDLESEVLCLAFAPAHDQNGSADTTVRLWSVAEGTLLLSLEGHSSAVRSVAFSPDGRTLASGSEDHSIRLWSPTDGAALRKLDQPYYSINDIYSVAFTWDSKTLVSGSGDGGVRLWGVEEGVLLRVVGRPTAGVKSVALSRDGCVLAIGGENKTVQLFSMTQGVAHRACDGHIWSVDSVALSPDGKMLASGGIDETVRLWSTEDGTLLRVLRASTKDAHVKSVAFSPRGGVLASGGEDKVVRLWSVAEGVALCALKEHSGEVTSLAFSQDGRTLASGSADKTVRLWRVEDAGGGRAALLGTLALEGHAGSVTSVAFSPDGETLASGSDDKTVRLWNAHTGALLRVLELEPGEVECVAFAPDGATLASTSSGAVRLWSAADGALLRVFEGESASAASVAFSPSGKVLASGAGNSEGDDVLVWSVVDGTLLSALKGHTNSVVSLAFSSDGKTLASGSWDETVRLWDVVEEKLLQDSGAGSHCLRRLGRTVFLDLEEAVADEATRADEAVRRVFEGEGGVGWGNVNELEGDSDSDGEGGDEESEESDCDADADAAAPASESESELEDEEEEEADASDVESVH